jgi:hypothetical protein
MSTRGLVLTPRHKPAGGFKDAAVLGAIFVTEPSNNWGNSFWLQLFKNI